MKVISFILFHFTFIVVAKSPGFFDEQGAFSKKLDIDKIHSCIKNCSNYVNKDSCGSISTKNNEQYSDLLIKAYQRVKEPLCDLDLGNISFGEVRIPLAIDDDSRRCYLKGPLNVEMAIIAQNGMDPDICVTKEPRYEPSFYMPIVFLGLSVYCASCPSMDSQLIGRVHVQLDFSFRYHVHFANPKIPTMELDRNDTSPVLTYPDGEPKDISFRALDSALRNVFTAENVRLTLGEYIISLSVALLRECIFPTCGYVQKMLF